ncbi:uncharacterized protein BXZ73DRAFT_95362 [Epithele typhae]|uniref:uncharacterized protein n=1 Tax=Epithele typhae TaxID=378194 RepID=UPI0020086E89|nr:uncharacterized protein BXZ73DRAFT_95362 [Epithele typhae]KAH9945841.1 hypothetical protein BXZ73DRAFT_95362 [Epithele typhae]
MEHLLIAVYMLYDGFGGILRKLYRDTVDLLWVPFNSDSRETARRRAAADFDPKSVQDVSVLDKLSVCCIFKADHDLNIESDAGVRDLLDHVKAQTSLPEDWFPVPTNSSILFALFADVSGFRYEDHEKTDISAFYEENTKFDYDFVVLPHAHWPDSSPVKPLESVRLLSGTTTFNPPYHCGISYTGKKLLQLFPDGRLDKSVFAGLDRQVVTRMIEILSIYIAWITASPQPQYLASLYCPGQGSNNDRNGVVSSGGAGCSMLCPREKPLSPRCLS